MYTKELLTGPLNLSGGLSSFGVSLIGGFTISQELAKKVEMDYQETSAKENTNVEGLFTALVREMIKSGQAGKDSTGVIQITSTTHRSKKSKDGGCCSKS